MDFIDDYDFVPAMDRPVLGRIPNGPDIFNLSARRAVNFEDVDRAVFIDLKTEFAFVAGRWGWSLLAVQRLGKDPGHRCFADAAHARKNIGLGDAVIFYGVLKSLHNWLLADHLLESLRPVFAGVYLV